jgi:hypothetical protein
MVITGLDKLSIVQLCHQKLQIWKSEGEINDLCKELDKKVSIILCMFSTYILNTGILL